MCACSRCCQHLYYFFFSSRRRHTRFDCDWSSDVCSSDLINTTDSAVRITHIPSGIVVQCQIQRSQHQNRAVAMQVLRSRLYEMELEKRRAETKELEANKQEISFGSQIRNYVLAPYRLVKDARTKLERGDVDSVLNGDLDDFIKEYLLLRREA